MKQFLSLTLFVILFCTGMLAQRNITIKGTIENGKGKLVQLYRYTDKISRLELLVDTCTIGDNQKFELHCYANYPMLVYLQIENYSQSFYVEPGRVYNTYIGDFDWDINEKQNVFLDPVTLPLEFINIPEDDINLLIDSLDRVVNRYIVAHRAAFDQRFRPQAKYFDSLMIEVNKRCPDIEGKDFFNRYKRYSLAEMKLNMRLDTRKRIFETYIQNQPILCYDENYMSLFTALYANSISKGSKYIDVYRLAHWIYNLDLATFSDSLGMDPLLRHEQIRELAALQALKEAYYNFHYYDNEMVIKMVKEIGSRTKFAEHRNLANKIVQSFHAATEKETYKNFTLPNVDKNPISLDTFAGMWTYIAFVRVEDPNCLGELETMAHFLDTVYRSSDSIEFLTIVCDREFQKMFHFLKNSKHGDKYDWGWLHFDGHYDLLQQFGICSYPSFVLLDPQGRPHYNVTPSPSSGIFLNPPWTTRPQSQPRRSKLLQHLQRQSQSK